MDAVCDNGRSEPLHRHGETPGDCRPAETSAQAPIPELVLPKTATIGALDAAPAHTPHAAAPLAPHVNLLNVAACQGGSPREHARSLKRSRREPERPDAEACMDGHVSDGSSTTAGEPSQSSLRARRPCLRGKDGAASPHSVGSSAAAIDAAYGVQEASPVRHGIGSLLAHASDCVAKERSRGQVDGSQVHDRGDDEQRDGDETCGADGGAPAEREKLTGAAEKYWLGSCAIASQLSEQRSAHTPEPDPSPALWARVSDRPLDYRDGANDGALRDGGSATQGASGGGLRDLDVRRPSCSDDVLRVRQRDGGTSSDAAADIIRVHRAPAPPLISSRSPLPPSPALAPHLAHGVQSDQRGQRTADRLGTDPCVSPFPPSQPARILNPNSHVPPPTHEASATVWAGGAASATQMSEVLSIRGVGSPTDAVAHAPLCQPVAPFAMDSTPLDGNAPLPTQSEPARMTASGPYSSAPTGTGNRTGIGTGSGTESGPLRHVPPPLPQPAHAQQRGRRLVQVAEESLGAARMHGSQPAMTNRSFWDCSFKADSQGQRSEVSERNHEDSFDFSLG